MSRLKITVPLVIVEDFTLGQIGLSQVLDAALLQKNGFVDC